MSYGMLSFGNKKQCHIKNTLIIDRYVDAIFMHGLKCLYVFLNLIYFRVGNTLIILRNEVGYHLTE
jgi:hypothetical protein